MYQGPVVTFPNRGFIYTQLNIPASRSKANAFGSPET